MFPSIRGLSSSMEVILSCPREAMSYSLRSAASSAYRMLKRTRL